MKKKIPVLLLTIVLLMSAFAYPAFAARSTAEVVEAALQLLYYNEGSYSSVNADDNGAVSVGKIQWHANRALNLLKTIVKADKDEALSILGEDLYNEILTATSWKNRTVNATEKKAISTLLKTDQGKAAQDALATKDVTNYINRAKKLGIVDDAALVYFADLENQGGSGMSTRVAKAAANKVGGYAKITLLDLHNAALEDSVAGRYDARRNKTYKYCKNLNWANTCTITFNVNGGSCATASKTATIGGEYGTLPTPTRENYDFQGWYTSASGGTRINSSSTVSGNTTLYAQWKRTTYTISLVNSYSQKNYFPDSAFVNGADSYNYSSRDEAVYQLYLGSDESRVPEYKVMKIVASAPGSSGKDLAWRTYISGSTTKNNYVATDKVTSLSFWAKASVPGAKMYIRWGHQSTDYYTTVDLSTEWTYYTFRKDHDDTYGNVMHPYFDKAGTYWISELQLEDNFSGTEFVNEAGGSSTMIVEAGGTYADLPTLTREGYNFLGWYTSIQGGQRVYATDTVANGNRCLYARWEEAVHYHAYRESTVEPTCTEQGYTTFTCACGDSYVTDYVEPVGHSWDNGTVSPEPTCTEAGTRTFTCSGCGSTRTENIPAAGHDFTEGVVVLEPTATEAGLMAYTCRVCRYSEFREIPALGLDHADICPSKDFVDVPGEENWAHAGIDYALENGLFSGTGPTTFEPNTNMSRAMLVTVLWRYEGKPETGSHSFTDVPEGQWYSQAVAWAASEGVVAGKGDGTFDPTGDVTREQMALILYRYAQRIGVDTSRKVDISSYPDASRVAGWSEEAVRWAVAEEIISGAVKDGQTVLAPQDSATRAVVASIMMRFIENVVN